MEINNINEQLPKTIVKEGVEVEGDAAKEAADSRPAISLPVQEQAPMLSAQAPAGGPALQASQQKLTELLLSYGFKATEENMALLDALLAKQMPLDQSTVQKLNQFLKFIRLSDASIAQQNPAPENASKGQQTHLDGDNSTLHRTTPLEKALFFLENEIHPNKANLQVLEQMTHTQKTILSQIEHIAEAMATLPESPVKEALVRLFSGEDLISPSANQLDAQSELPAFAGKNQHEAAGLLEEAVETIMDKKPAKQEAAPDAARETSPEKSRETPEKAIIREFMQTNKTIGQKELTALAKALFPDSEEDAKAFLSQFSSTSRQPEKIKQTLLNRFTIHPEKMNERDIDKTLNSLRDALSKGEKLLEKGDLPKSLGMEMKAAREHLEFYDQLKTCVYVPLPLNMGGRTTPGELYVFKDGKQAKIQPDHASALIALNTVNLGRIETYLQKRRDTLTIQFRISMPDAEPLLKANAQKLAAALKEHHYTVKNLSITPLDTPFHILDAEPEQSFAGKPTAESILFDQKA